jgi:uncharacterized protein
MTLKRLGLILLTLVAVLFSGTALLESLQKPQFQSRLELYQADIVLQASSWQPEGSNDGNLQKVSQSIIGAKPLENAREQYQEVRDSAIANLDKIKNQPQAGGEQSLKQLEKLLPEIDLRLGILLSQQGQTDKALKTWQQLQQGKYITPSVEETAAVLAGIWSNPQRLLPNDEELIKSNLDGWFRSTALIKLYQLEQRPEALATIQAAQQEAASQALSKLAIIVTIPYLTALIGMGLLIFITIQRFVKGKDSLLSQNGDLAWTTPWDWETILQVFVVGFFFMVQIAVPILLNSLPIPRPLPNARIQAIFVLVSYLLVASGSISVLYLSIKPYLPLADDWFRFQLKGRWFLWGLGGYCVGVPIVAIVSLINQQLWQGQGGSNPLLQLVLESRDTLALSIFFSTAAIAAPFFEEILFRGFLLPGLTRYLPVWASIILSALLFATAHLSFSEIIPLTSLGIVLGVVYTRTRNLLAPILLHSLWNSSQILTLFILGSK